MFTHVTPEALLCFVLPFLLLSAVILSYLQQYLCFICYIFLLLKVHSSIPCTGYPSPFLPFFLSSVFPFGSFVLFSLLFYCPSPTFHLISFCYYRFLFLMPVFPCFLFYSMGHKTRNRFHRLNILRPKSARDVPLYTLQRGSDKQVPYPTQRIRNGL